jgi:FdhE protein
MASFNDKIISLQNAAAKSPEYAEILPFFIELFRFLDKQGGESGITFKSNMNCIKERVANGFPLISSDSIITNKHACVVFICSTIELLKRIGREGENELNKIEAALLDARLDPSSIIKAALERKRSVIDEAAIAIDVPAPLLEYIFEIPLKAAFELFAATVETDTLSDWQESYCPVCGSRAGMAELVGEEGKRRLCCSTCAFIWPFKRLQCPFCNNDDIEKLSYFLAGDGPTRVDTCKACSRYIKTRDSKNGIPDLPLDLEDLLTIHLDILATKEGYERGK